VQRFLERIDGAQTERAGLAWRWRGQLGARADDRDRDREEHVRLGCRVRDGSDPSAWSKGSAHTGQGTRLVWEVDEADPGHNSVEVPRLDLEVLAVHDPSGDEGGEPGSASRVVGVRKQVGRDICGEHASSRTDAACGGDALAACAGGDVEDGAAGADLGEVEHDVGRLTEPGVDYGAPAVPGGCCCLPLVGGSRLVPSGVERRHDGGCRRRGGRGPCASSAGWSVVMCASIVDTTCSLPSP
jgi:hypothetical protein